MDFPRLLPAWLRALLTRTRAHREVDEELSFHLEMETRAHVARGLAPDEARRRAVLDLGGFTQTRDAVRDVRTTAADAVALDLRHAVRRFAREPGLGSAAIVAFGLTVGLATTVFSVADSVLLRPFPFVHQDRLLFVFRVLGDVDFGALPVPELADLRARARSLEDVGGFTRDTCVLLTPHGARWTNGFQVTANLLDLVGARPIRGRTLAAADAEAGREPVAVLGAALWRSAFDGDPDIVGRVVQARPEGSGDVPPTSYRIVGVVEADLEVFYPTHLAGEMYTPRVEAAADRTEEARGDPTLLTIARRRPGVTTAQAAEEVVAVLSAVQREHPGTSLQDATSRALPFHDELVGRTRPAFRLMAAAAALLLLAGCANITGLLLASGLRRGDEFAARLAIGCAPGRLLRQLLTEHLLLALAGASVGIGAAAALLPALRVVARETFPRASSIQLQPLALAVALGVTFVAWLASGLLPAAFLARRRHDVTLRPGTASTLRDSRFLRRAVIATESALVVLLLSSAGLLGHSLWRVAGLNLGFDADGVFAAHVVVPERLASASQRAGFGSTLVERLRADPRVADASLASTLPFTWTVLDTVRADGGRPQSIRAVTTEVDSHYASLLRIPVLEGRGLLPADTGNPHVAVVNEAAARRLFGGRAVGQRVVVGNESRLVVGVAGNLNEIGELRAGLIRRAGLSRLTLPAVYVPVDTTRETRRLLLCRFRPGVADPARLVGEQLRARDPEATLRQAGWLADRVGSAGADVRFCALVVGVFAASALALAVVGLYGTLAHALGARTREIGIRTALGASPLDLQWMVVRDPAACVGLGALAGLSLALATTRWLRAFLFEVPPRDPWTLALAVTVLALAAGGAAWLPARAAVRLDPVQALRTD